jgi:subtilisin family serine protease
VTTDCNAPSAYIPDNAVARLVLEDPNVFSNAHQDDDALVLALRAQLLVHRPTRHARTDLDKKLRAVADPVTIPSPPVAGTKERLETSSDGDGDSAAGQFGIELWRLNPENENRNPIDVARELLEEHGSGEHVAADGTAVTVPSVTPHHLAIVSGGRGSGCPAGPPREARSPERPFLEPFEGRGGPQVVILDTGYFQRLHPRLDERVTVTPGQWLNTRANPPAWQDNPPDEITQDAHGRLVGIVGHGTFIAGQVAHTCPQAAITVVGHRDEEISTDAPSYRLWASELSLARSLWQYRDADVIQCGFAFPTLDNGPSLPFTTMMAQVRAANPGIAVVAPAGNEDSTREYWPAALPDVIGVAATKHDGRHRAHFSNWGSWVDCCAIGQDVRSTYINYKGRVEDEHPDDVEVFEGWCRWQGTSFAAPKVSAAIAQAVVEHPEWTPAEAYRRLVDGGAGVEIRQVADHMWPGGTLPELVIH